MIPNLNVKRTVSLSSLNQVEVIAQIRIAEDGKATMCNVWRAEIQYDDGRVIRAGGPVDSMISVFHQQALTDAVATVHKTLRDELFG